MKQVFSSHISEIGHHDGNLHVKFKDGKQAVYQNVPRETADKIMNSASIGQALHEHVRGKFSHSYHE